MKWMEPVSHEHCFSFCCSSMSLPSYPAVVADRDSLPLKKRDQRPSPPLQHPQCDSAIFKAPYPYKQHTSPFQPVPRRVPPLYQPWTNTSSRTKPPFLSAFRDYPNCTEWNESEWSLFHFYQQHTHLSAHLNYPRHASTRPGPLETPHNGSVWEDRLQHTSLTAQKEKNGRTKESYVRRKDQKTELSSVENANPLLLSSRFPHSVSNISCVVVILCLKSLSPCYNSIWSLEFRQEPHGKKWWVILMKISFLCWVANTLQCLCFTFLGKRRLTFVQYL